MAATPEDLKLIQAGYHANWLPEKLRRDLWEYTLTREPYFVKFRRHDLKTRPKINFADPNENGEYPLYRWGQERQSYGLVEKIPPPVRAIMDFIEDRFGAKTNLAMATYYWNGKDHYIPAHCDRKVTVASEGRVETASRIFNVSLGAVRPFLITATACLGKAERSDMDILAEFPQECRLASTCGWGPWNDLPRGGSWFVDGSGGPRTREPRLRGPTWAAIQSADPGS